jgi:ParB/RepB/Spo0J family partition protein
MAEAICVNPFSCRMWEGHERLEEHINEDTCREEIDSFLAHGQLLPVLARPLKGDLTHEFELIYGARRLFVARHLNVGLRVELRELTDSEAIIALDIENRLRKDLSPYERGRSYSLWLRNGYFSSQDELAKALNVSPSQVSRLIRLAQLPSVIVSAFPSPLAICETWGRSLMEKWEDPEKCRAMAKTARAMAKESAQAHPVAIFKRLIADPADRDEPDCLVRAEEHDEVVKDHDGRPLFRVREHRRDTAILLPTSMISSMVLSEIKYEVAAILRRAREQSAKLPMSVGGELMAAAMP